MSTIPCRIDISGDTMADALRSRHHDRPESPPSIGTGPTDPWPSAQFPPSSARREGSAFACGSGTRNRPGMPAQSTNTRGRRGGEIEPRILRILRERTGRTQIQFGHELGVSRVSIARYESGARQPSRPVLDRYLRLLDDLAADAHRAVSDAVDSRETTAR